MAEDNVQPVSVPQIESHGKLMDTVERRAKAMKTIELVVLGVLCLVVIAFLVFRGVSSGKAPDAESSAVHIQTVSEANSTEKSLNPEEISLVKGSVAQRDPFTPLVHARTASAPARSSMYRNAPLIPPMKPDFGFEAPVLPRNGAEVVIQEPEPDPSAELTVTGILCGQPNVAVIRDKSAGRHYVRVGDKIGERLTVLSIEKGRVLLKAGGKNVTLTLGGNKDASKS